MLIWNEKAIRARGSRGRDRGSASLWLLTVGLVLLAAAGVGASVGAARVGRHEARVAADLGALAGAAHAAWEPATACARAARIVTANGGRLTSCTLDGFDIQVSVEVVTTPLPAVARVARATARAGPVRG